MAQQLHGIDMAHQRIAHAAVETVGAGTGNIRDIIRQILSQASHVNWMLVITDIEAISAAVATGNVTAIIAALMKLAQDVGGGVVSPSLESAIKGVVV